MGLHVALLRGINVGGKNIIRMAELRACFEEHGFKSVETYIQSGNVIFEAGERSGGLAERIEQMLTSCFDYRASVVLRTHAQLARIVRDAPAGFGADSDRYRYDVLFLKEPLTARVAIESVRAREGVDEASAGPGVIYFSRVAEHASRSWLGKLTALAIYERMTIRNWNTTTTLLEMMEA